MRSLCRRRREFVLLSSCPVDLCQLIPDWEWYSSHHSFPDDYNDPYNQQFSPHSPQSFFSNVKWKENFHNTQGSQVLGVEKEWICRHESRSLKVPCHVWWGSKDAQAIWSHIFSGRGRALMSWVSGTCDSLPPLPLCLVTINITCVSN